MSATREMIPDGVADPKNEASIVKPYVMSHGTMEVYDLKASRRFYEEFLGMQCVRHGASTMAIRCGLKSHIVCVEVGEALKPVHMLNHWGLDVRSDEEVDRAYQEALRCQEKYGIRKIFEPKREHGVYSFFFVDLDHNWWEIQHYWGGVQNEDMFDFGDRFTMDGKAL
ncbi:VOC family protein [Ferribacterium limneticum]|uniref:VOC family protein n=1 Tax=Ferribacterium limneticum TaxID=76259 RepID=UPI001CF9734A|nr:VOC family protein [Ferribacterium limneticum]UCV17846.1 VOC family protein [Ferribacterium limneticum]